MCINTLVGQIDKMFSFMETQPPPMESNTTKCRQPPMQKVYLSTLLGLGPYFFLFCTTTCTHFCLKSLYFLPFFNPHKKQRRVTCNSLQNSPFFFVIGFKGAMHGRRLCKINHIFFASLPSLIHFLASFQTFLHQVSE